jgi:hypothetical protein
MAQQPASAARPTSAPLRRRRSRPFDAPRLALDQIEQSIGREGHDGCRSDPGAVEPRTGARRSARGDRRLRTAARDVDAGASSSAIRPLPARRRKIRRSWPSVRGSISATPKSMRRSSRRGFSICVATILPIASPDKRRNLFTQQLLSRSSSALDPAFLGQCRK